MVVIAVAGEVLNMVVQVTFIVATLSTDSAYIGPQLTLREFDNVFKGGPPAGPKDQLFPFFKPPLRPI